MGKKKIFKDDGVTEDFDAESKELDTEDTTTADDSAKSDDALKDGGFLGQAADVAPQDKAPEHDAAPDMLKEDGVPDTKDAPADALKVDEVTDADAAKSVEQDAGAAVTDAPAGDAAAEAPKADEGPKAILPEEVAVADKVGEATDSSSDSSEDADKVPELAAPHAEAEPIVSIAPEALDMLKEAGNKLTPALKMLQKFEDKFQELENEAKARFQHARQKATEAVAALEAIFKRD